MRSENWPELLAEYLTIQQEQPFEWGVNDCVLFAAQAVQAMTGRQPVSVNWSTATGAARALKKAGGIEAATSQILGTPLASALMAQRGDVGLLMGERGDYLAICTGLAWAGPGPQGIQLAPFDRAKVAWRVG